MKPGALGRRRARGIRKHGGLSRSSARSDGHSPARDARATRHLSSPRLALLYLTYFSAGTIPSCKISLFT